MYDTVIIHGSYGNPFGNWFPWLHRTLEAQGRKVLVPQFPIGDIQTLENWTRIMDAYAGMLAENFDVFAHSAGPAFLVNYVQNRNITVGKAVLVAPFFGMIGIESFDAVNQTFMQPPMSPKDLMRHAREVVCVFSNNDPYVPQELSEDFCRDVDGKRVIIEGGGHLNTDAGFVEFPLLLEI